jgi:hypothetical protein
MPWFNVDDGAHSHPKVLAAGNAAFGLFTRLGSYSAHYSTEGRVPVEIVHDFGTKRERDRLMAIGMLQRVGDEYVMHDFLDYNRDAAQVAHDRARAAERQRRKRERERDRHGVTHAPQAKAKAKPRPSTSSNPTAAAALTLPDAAAAAVDLLIEHRLATEPGIRSPKRYADRLRAEIPSETPALYQVNGSADPVTIATELLGMTAAQAMTADYHRRQEAQ